MFDNVRIPKDAFENNAMPNNSMDVRAKQRLSYHVAWFLSACVYSVSPHVNSSVMFLAVIFGGEKATEKFLQAICSGCAELYNQM